MEPQSNELQVIVADFKSRNQKRENLLKFLKKKGRSFHVSDVGEFLNSKDEYVLDITLRKIGALGIKSNFPVIEKFTYHVSGVVRAAAANALGQIRDRRAVPILEQLSMDSNYFVTWEAIIALSNIGTKEANPVFLKGLKYPHPTIRMLSARALGENRETESLVQLVRAASDINKSVRAAVIEALGKANYYPAFTLIEEALSDSDIEVRTVAILAIANFPQKKLLRYFKQSIKDHSDSVRLATIKALEILGYDESVVLIQQLISDRNPMIRQAVIKTLGEIGSFEQIQPIANFLQDKNPKVRAEAVNSLGKLGYTESTKYLLTAVKDSHKNVRSAAAAALCLINEQFEINPNIASSHFNIHLQNLDSGDLLVREEAVKNLCYSGVSFAVEPLIEAAKDAYIEIRRLAIKALVLVRNKKVFGIIHKGLADPCLRVKWESVYHLDLYSDMVKLSDVIKLFSDPEPSIRLKCVQILEYNKSPEALDTLLKGINDSDVLVRRITVKAICSYNSPDIVGPLKQVLVDQVPEIACIAAIKLGELKINAGASLIIQSMRSSDIQMIRQALQVANLLNTSTFVTSAVKLISSPDPEIKYLAMAYVSTHAEQQILKNIKDVIMTDSDPKIIELGLNALGRIRNYESYELLKKFAEHNKVEVREHVYRNMLLMNIPLPEKEKIIASIFQENFGQSFREEVLNSIESVLGKSGKDYLLQLINTSSPNISVQAVLLLKNYYSPEIETYLLDLAKTKKGRLSEAAQETLISSGYSRIRLFFSLMMHK